MIWTRSTAPWASKSERSVFSVTEWLRFPTKMLFMRLGAPHLFYTGFFGPALSSALESSALSIVHFWKTALTAAALDSCINNSCALSLSTVSIQRLRVRFNNVMNFSLLSRRKVHLVTPDPLRSSKMAHSRPRTPAPNRNDTANNFETRLFKNNSGRAHPVLLPYGQNIRSH